MPIFVTYARKDRAAVEALSRDLERARNSVWLDNELTGGQAWWDTIPGQIRACDLYMFALSPESLKSRACNSELQYALAVGRPLLPVQVQDVHITMTPPAIADTQIVDYRARTVENGIALISAVANRPAAPPLPDPLPVPPPPPMSYMNEYRELVDAPYLTFQQQNHLLVDLRGYLNHDDDDRIAALSLIQGLRQRRDIAEGVGREIDQLLAERAPGPIPSGYSDLPTSAQTPPVFNQPPQTNPYPSPPAPLPQANPYPSTPPPPQTPGPRSYYSGPMYSGPGPASPHPQGTVILILAIASFFSCGLTGVIALILAGRALKEIDANPAAYNNRGVVVSARAVAVAGLVLGIIFLLFMLLGSLLPTT